MTKRTATATMATEQLPLARSRAGQEGGEQRESSPPRTVSQTSQDPQGSKAKQGCPHPAVRGDDIVAFKF